ncbi:hypothetical protein [Flavobacterium sp.]|uniref:hypothetical protein n=1 Tax=Flavobacterium sp. TaxID=239 RepID=UPI0026084BC5|nr:hypothetical protein [Flavobacterium sp.]
MKTVLIEAVFLNLKIMKNIVLTLFALVFLSACKKEMTIEDLKIEKPVNPFSEVCYQGIQGKDTIRMSLITKGDKLQYGKLSYKYFEKDYNEGTLTGAFKGDTLIGKYSFQSEGTMSAREVIFLKQGRNYIEGFGPVTDDGHGNVTFQNLKTIQFNNAIPLVEVPCNN